MEPRTCPHPTCGHAWTPRKAEPKKCPQCQNPLWRSSRPKNVTGSGTRRSSASPFAAVDGGATVREGQGQPPTAADPGDDLEVVRIHPDPEKDTLSQMKNRAEALLRQLA